MKNINCTNVTVSIRTDFTHNGRVNLTPRIYNQWFDTNRSIMSLQKEIDETSLHLGHFNNRIRMDIICDFVNAIKSNKAIMFVIENKQYIILDREDIHITISFDLDETGINPFGKDVKCGIGSVEFFVYQALNGAKTIKVKVDDSKASTFAMAV